MISPFLIQAQMGFYQKLKDLPETDFAYCLILQTLLTKLSRKRKDPMIQKCMRIGIHCFLESLGRKYFLLQKSLFIFQKQSSIYIFLVMMNGKSSVISHSEQNQLQQETNQKKTFVQDIFNINYVNTSKIYYQPTSQSSDVKVNNYLCYQQGQNLYKVTQIIYEDKLIRIEDKFEVNVDPQKLKSTSSVIAVKKERNCPKSMEKIRIFSKDARKNGKIEKKDKKNIVKNIVKIFISWLQKKQSQKMSTQWQLALNQLKKMLQVQNFNNRLIKTIVGNKNTSKAFLAFLTDDAEDQIKYSRINDKQSHFQAIELYISLLSQNKNGVKLNSQQFSRSYNDNGLSSSQNQDNELSNANRSQPSHQNNSENNAGNHQHMKIHETRNASSQPNPNNYNHINHVVRNVVNHNTIQILKKPGQEGVLKVKQEDDHSKSNSKSKSNGNSTGES